MKNPPRRPQLPTSAFRIATARLRCVSSPYHVVWRPGWMSDAGRAPAMTRAVSTMTSGRIVVSVKAHSGVLSATCFFSSSKPVAYVSTYSRS